MAVDLGCDERRTGAVEYEKNGSRLPRCWRRPRYLAPLTVLAVTAGYAVVSYPGYRAAMRDARESSAGGSQLIFTAAGSIEYADLGVGSPVLVVHGNGGGYDQGVALGKALVGSGYRLIVPSRFGYLRTPVPDDGSPEAQADAYAALLDELGVERVAVMAVSDGGPSGLQFVLRHPERSSGLVMVSAKSQTPPEETIVQKAVFGTLFRSDYLYWTVTERFEPILLSMLGMPKQVRSQLSADQQELAAEFLRTMHPISLRKAGIYNDRKELSKLSPEVFELGRIKTPSLIVHGTRDSLQPFSQGLHAAQQIPGARLEVFEGGGHMLVEHLPKIRAEIGDFLVQNGHRRLSYPESAVWSV